MKMLIQGLTLTSFVVLMSTFVLYRGGYFNAYLTSPNGGVAPQKGNIVVQDTTKKKKKRIISSSKSGRVIEIDEPVSPADTTKQLFPNINIMGGSKSGVIFIPPADTTKQKPKPKPRPRVMSGSKSGEIFTPERIDTTKQQKKIKPKK
jgi:hypothetical protein